MPNVALSSEELDTIAQAVAMQITSAQRAQKTGKTPQIIAVYKTHEATLKELEAKILKAANTKQQ